MSNEEFGGYKQWVASTDDLREKAREWIKTKRGVLWLASDLDSLTSLLREVQEKCAQIAGGLPALESDFGEPHYRSGFHDGSVATSLKIADLIRRMGIKEEEQRRFYIPTMEMCPNCQHSLQGNSHGMTQGDPRGQCTYCKECIKEEEPRCTQDDGTPWPTKYGCGGAKCGDCEP